MAVEHGIARQNRVQRSRSQSDRARYERIKQKRRRMKRRRAIIFFIKAMLIVSIAFSVLLYFERKNDSHPSLSSKDITDFLDGGLNDSLGEGKTLSISRSAFDSTSRVVGQDYINLCGLDQVDKPRTRTSKQVLERLEYLASDNDLIREILQDSASYPPKMLEALANNPEMADFVLGYPESDGQVLGGLTKDEMKQDFPLFLQWDPRWGYAEYGDDSNIGLAGCGPTCLSMALYYLTKDESLTPDYIAAYSMKNGYYIAGTGTAWALMQDVPEKYGIGVSQPKAEEYTMKDALDRGRVIICSMGPGDFTAAGHFIVIYGYDADGFLVNDPNCVARSRKSWSFSELKGQIKNVWVLGGKMENNFSMESSYPMERSYSMESSYSIVTEFYDAADYSIY